MMESQEYGRQKKNMRDHRYAKGVVTGVLSTAFVFLLLSVVVLFWLQGRIRIGGSVGAAENLVDSSVRTKIGELAAMIEEYYYKDVDAQEMADGLYKGLFASLQDPYSAYYTEEEYEEMMISAGAKYYGIGVVLIQDRETMQVQINRVYDGTPAHEAGLKAGDTIVRVGDLEAQKVELSELVSHIRGQENSSVHLIIARKGEPERLEFDVRRDEVNVPTVVGRMLEDDIGYIGIAEFGEATAEDFEHQVERLQAEGMEKMIIDLRDNPGGMLNSVKDILDYILPEGLIVYTEDKYGNRQELFSDAEQYLELPMAVLINKNSASCSEIFAGAVRDYDYATLIGTTTYGKGIVQTVRQLSDKSAIKLTTAKYFTPKGENIHGTGIDPDIELKYEYTGEEDETYDFNKDNQIKKALRVLKSTE